MDTFVWHLADIVGAGIEVNTIRGLGYEKFDIKDIYWWANQKLQLLPTITYTFLLKAVIRC
jgi:hypothetical protein